MTESMKTSRDSEQPAFELVNRIDSTTYRLKFVSAVHFFDMLFSFQVHSSSGISSLTAFPISSPNPAE
jgi:hypothetical protein